MLARLAAILLLAGIAAAEAGPSIPSSELPGRERQRFLETPIDRFTQPPKGQAPLWSWDCEPGQAKSKKKRGRKKGC